MLSTIEIRKKLKEEGIYSNDLCKWRLYLPRSELGLGLINIKDEYGRELIRTMCQIISYNRINIIELQKYLNEKWKCNSMIGKIEKIFRRRLEIKEIIEDIENGNNQIDIIRKINEKINKYL